jgi:hypothetical protein
MGEVLTRSQGRAESELKAHQRYQRMKLAELVTAFSALA